MANDAPATSGQQESSVNLQQLIQQAAMAERQRNVNILTGIFAAEQDRDVRRAFTTAINVISGGNFSVTMLEAQTRKSDESFIRELAAQYDAETAA